MKVPLTVGDFLERAAHVYPDRPALIDEPEQPAPTWGTITYGELARRTRALAVALDRLGVGWGERVAVVSHNSARLATLMLGVSAAGRISVPVNFRLNAAEVDYIVSHCGARMLLIDPELADSLAAVGCEHRFVLGAEADEALFADAAAAEPRPWPPDEDAIAAINYTSGTTARPKGVQMTHRTIWLNAVTFGWSAGVSDRDVYLHTLPMFHCNGWGMPYTLTGVGAAQVVIRKVDGAEILRRIERHGVTYLCGAPAVVAAVLAAAEDWQGPIPGSGTVRMTVAGGAPPPPPPSGSPRSPSRSGPSWPATVWT